FRCSLVTTPVPIVTRSAHLTFSNSPSVLGANADLGGRQRYTLRGMSRIYACLLLCVSGLSVGCTKEKPVVVLDDSFNVAYAQSACRNLPGCVDGLGIEAQIRDFELELSTAFAVDASCRGVVLMSHPAKPTLEDLKKSWLLTLQ